MGRVYLAHCPAHRSVRQANYMLLIRDYRVLEHGKCLLSMHMGDSMDLILEDSPAASFSQHHTMSPW